MGTLLTKAQVADRLGIRQGTVKWLYRQGFLDAVFEDGNVYYTEESVERYEQSRRRRPDGKFTRVPPHPRTLERLEAAITRRLLEG